MKLSIAIATFVTAVLAAPASEIVKLDKHATTWVYVCNDINFDNTKAPCSHIPADAALCVPLASNYNDLLSSVGPDAGSYCYFFVRFLAIKPELRDCDADVYYSDINCQGQTFGVGNPGFPDLRNVRGVDFNDRISSYYCVNV